MEFVGAAYPTLRMLFFADPPDMYEALRNGTCKMGVQTGSRLRTMKASHTNCDLDGHVETLLDRPTGWIIDSQSCLNAPLKYAIFALESNSKLKMLQQKWFSPHECNLAKPILTSNQLHIMDMSGLFVVNGVIIVMTMAAGYVHALWKKWFKKAKPKPDAQNGHQTEIHTRVGKKGRYVQKEVRISMDIPKLPTDSSCDEQLAFPPNLQLGPRALGEMSEAPASGQSVPSQSFTATNPQPSIEVDGTFAECREFIQ